MSDPPPRRRWRYWFRSLRVRAFMVAVIVAFAPLSVVAVVGLIETRSEPEMELAVEQAAAEAAQALLASPRALVQPQATLRRAARRHHVRLRLLDSSGVLAADVDAEGAAANPLEHLFFGPEGKPELAVADLEQPPVAARPVVIQARREGLAEGCETWAAGKLRVCHVARTLDREGEVLGVLYAQQSHRRAIRALYDLRFALLKLTLFVAAGALLLGWWLGWRMVRPLHRLRGQALDKVQEVSPGALELAREDEIGELAAAFNRLLEALRERARHNEAFVADLAHEFKNPVAAVRAGAEALARQGDEPLPPARTARLARILRDSSQRLDALVTQFLELARAEGGMVGEERAPVRLGALVAGVVEALAAQEDHAAVSIRHEVDDEVIVSGVSGRLETAVRNLVANAASFAGQGGHVTVRLHRRGARIRLEVEDDGPGIAADDLPRVFERFFTRRQGKRGTGLGLALVRAIALAHGGTASVRSTVGEGSTFTLWLPAPGEDAALPSP